MVRRRDCGLLALRHNRELVEADVNFRKYGEVKPPVPGFDPFPSCSAMEPEFKIEEGEPGQNIYRRTLTTINHERDCDSFCKWMPTFSPKEHKQMLYDQRMLREKARDDKRWAVFHVVFGAVLTGTIATIIKLAF